ncbi:TPA: ferredoxin-type protein NapF [Citrobacter freundii]
MVDLSRRNMLTGSWHQARNEIRPPWSCDASAFFSHCLRCDACIQACETHVLQRGQGGYPAVNFTQHECSLCYACAQACSESLFLPRHTRAWDLLFTITEKCLAWQSIECRRCQDSCEPLAITFRPSVAGVYQPQLNAQICNGCGACAASCPTSAINVEYNHAAH